MARTMRVLPVGPDRSWIAAALEILGAGGIVAYPTDTIYGLAVDPRRTDAVAGLYRAKGRAAGMAIPLIAGDFQQACAAGVFGEVEARLAARFWPGPLSLVVPASPAVSPLLLGGGARVAIRVPAHSAARALALAFGYAITATSANQSGADGALTAAEAATALAGRIDAVIDDGAAMNGTPSTIVEVTSEGPRLLRAGPIAWERVLEFLP